MSDSNGIAQLIQQLRIVSSLITDRKEQGCSDENMENLLDLEGYLVGLITDGGLQINQITIVGQEMEARFTDTAIQEVVKLASLQNSDSCNLALGN